MGRPKALLPVAPAGGPTFLEALVSHLATAGCDPIVVVTGACDFAVPAPARGVRAAEWALGMRASLRAGLRELPHARGVLLTHVDRPCVRASTLAALLEGSPVVSRVPFHGGAPGHPVFLDAALCDRLAEAPESGPAVPLAQWLSAAGARRVDVDDPDILLNVNTPAELAAFHARGVPR